MGRRVALSDQLSSQVPQDPVPESKASDARRAWARALPWVALALVVLGGLGVFLLPWMVPSQVHAVQSEAQEFGFNNNVAYIAAMLAVLGLAALGWVWRRLDPEWSADVHPVMLDEPAPKSEAIPVWLVAALAAIVVGFVAVLAHFDGAYPNGDGAYFLDRILRLAAGGRLSKDFEFAYGPVIIYFPYGVWLALKGVGVTLYDAYYATVALAQALGVLATAYILNRLRLTRGVRILGVLTVFAFSITRLELGLNTVPVRFLAQFAIVVWVLFLARKSVWWASAAGAAGVALSFGISPEIGVTATVGIFAGLALQWRKDDWKPLLPAVVAGAVGLACYAGFALTGLSSLAGYSVGAAFLPMLPGQAGVVFLGMLMLIGFGIGMTSRRDEWRSSAEQIGYVLAALLMAKAAMGRADAGHMFINGLGAILIALALVSQLKRAWGIAFGSVVAVVFLVTAVTANVNFVPSMYSSAVGSGAISRTTSMKLAPWLGRTPETGRQWFNGARAKTAEPTDADVRMLLASKKVVLLGMASGKVAFTLAENHALLPMYAVPWLALDPGQVQPTIASFAKADYVLMPLGDYRADVAAAKSRPVTAPVSWMRRPTAASDELFYSSQCGFPLTTHPVNPVYEPLAVFGQVLKRDWVLDRVSGSYVILRHKP